MTTSAPTPGQTVGPFFGYALPYAGGNELVPPTHPGAVWLHGTVYDGAGLPVPDALLEVWQPDATGKVVRRPGSLHRDGHTFTGWGRAATDNAGHYWFSTVEPGPTRQGGAPFIALTVFARGLLDRLFTRIYLPDHPALNTDALLTSVPQERRRTLVAHREDEDALRFDVHLQGEQETVFLRHPRHVAS
ncbi:MAG TPA: protocatechuate 3,4-dioxygenase subunit alpha [Segeticoccus sp.]|uniref:protocatechuate 3,4-dioxygenase subunit alpha n=1 Tax=Segeticoccus sp. TaxID=2706531 RepID=UPI002D7E5413|nr:protocatechuate 3,4-dioxygenase subunit alpha [Segeticoccus sp.]HET8601825.1 protocatechuate 3,4-dioxygenase subunit alpha [Segeticoccus sp.]